MGSVLHQWSVFAYCIAREKKTFHIARVCNAQKCPWKHLSPGAVPVKATLRESTGSATFPVSRMLTGKLTHIHSGLFAVSVAFLISKIAHRKRVANIFGYEISNSLLEESLLEPTVSPAKYSHSLSLQALIYAFLSKGSLEELSVFPFYTTKIFFYQLLISGVFFISDFFQISCF